MLSMTELNDRTQLIYLIIPTEVHTIIHAGFGTTELIVYGSKIFPQRYL